MNFLTDDPWNPAHRSRWFEKSLRHYDYVFSPRNANLQDLRAHGCNASYLPFAYCPEVHFPAPDDGAALDEADVIFAGGADRDRVPYLRALASAGLKIVLYGGYWDRVSDLRQYWRGHANLDTLRQATKTARIVLCLVRSANRDGHSMRSFEVPAMHGCLLAEDTLEHRAILGSDCEAAAYFRSIPEMLERAKWLLQHESERKRLAAAGYRRITTGQSTYMDRLQTMIQGDGLRHRDASPASGSLKELL